MTQALGMPAARPFVLDGSEKVFVVRANTLNDVVSAKHLRDYIGIDYSVERADFEGKSVLGFSEPELRTFLDRSGLVVVERYGSNIPNIEWVRLIRKPDLPWFMGWKLHDNGAFLDYQFQFKRWEGDNWQGMAYVVTRTLSQVLKRKILFDVPHGHAAECTDRGAFQIYVWSTPRSSSRAHTPPEEIWGYPVNCRDSSFQPTGQTPSSVIIRDGAWAVAEMLPNALYIHHDLVHRGTSNELKIMLKLLTEVARFVGDPAEYEAFVQRAREAHAKEQREIFTCLVEKSIPERSKRHEELVSLTKEKIDRVRGELVTAERELFGLQQSLLDPKEVARRFEEELLKLQQGKVALVQDLFFRAHRGGIPRLHALTEEITSVNPSTGKTHLLGQYEIIFDLERAQTRFLNRDRRPEGVHGPHLDNDGSPCFGNIADDMAGYIGHFEIEAALALAIAFLQSPNMDDSWGRKIRYFPVVGEEPERACA